MHSKNLVHRDVKPDNFVIKDNDSKNNLYIIDFGLVRAYRDPRSKIHIPYRDERRLTGTARYASINTHMGIEQTRRDDLEGIAYSLIYLLNGKLCWQGLHALSKMEKYEKILEMKMSIPIERLCKGLPGFS